MSLFRGKRQTLPRLNLTESERRVLRHGPTKGCPMCEEAVESLKEKGITLPNTWVGAAIQ